MDGAGGPEPEGAEDIGDGVMSAEDDNQEAVRRKFEALKADVDALLQRMAEQAAVCGAFRHE